MNQKYFTYQKLSSLIQSFIFVLLLINMRKTPYVTIPLFRALSLSTAINYIFAITFLFLFFSVINKTKAPQFSKYLKFCLLLIALVIIDTFNSLGQKQEYSLINQLFRYLTIIFAASLGVLRTWQRPTQSKGVAILFSALCLYASISFYNVLPYLLSETGSRRFDIEELNAISIGYTTGILSSGLFAVALYKFNKYSLLNIVLILSCFYYLLCLLSLGNRGATLFITITFAVVLVKSFDFGFKNHLKMILFGFIFISALVVVVQNSDFLTVRMEFLLNRFLPTFYWFRGDDFISADDASSGRFSIMRSYFSSFFSWFILGYRGFRETYPHNILLEFWVRFGFVGLFVSYKILRLFIDIIRVNWQLYELDFFDRFMAGVFIFSFLQTLTSMRIEHVVPMWSSCIYLFLIFKDREPRLNHSQLIYRYHKKHSTL